MCYLDFTLVNYLVNIIETHLDFALANSLSNFQLSNVRSTMNHLDFSTIKYLINLNLLDVSVNHQTYWLNIKNQI